MQISHFTHEAYSGGRRTSALVQWEDTDRPDHTLFFDISDGDECGVELSADAFVAACFPLAVLHGERRMQIAAPVCPMLVEGLRTVYAWWRRWGDPAPAFPAIDHAGRSSWSARSGRRRAVSFLSGGVDGLHLLHKNRRLYGREDDGYIRDALIVNGLDMGKRADTPHADRFEATVRHLAPLAEQAGVRLVPCRTNLRHLPSAPNFWMERFNGAALASVAHAAATQPGFAFISASQDIAAAIPAGSHPSTDGYYSTQRVTIILDSAHLTRLQKLRELSEWTAAIDRLRVCGMNIGDLMNCGVCEKCLRTRLELLAIGREESALGSGRVPVDLLDQVTEDISPRILAHYEDLLPFIRRPGLEAICSLIEAKIAKHGERARRARELVAGYAEVVRFPPQKR